MAVVAAAVAPLMVALVAVVAALVVAASVLVPFCSMLTVVPVLLGTALAVFALVRAALSVPLRTGFPRRMTRRAVSAVAVVVLQRRRRPRALARIALSSRARCVSAPHGRLGRLGRAKRPRTGPQRRGVRAGDGAALSAGAGAALASQRGAAPGVSEATYASICSIVSFSARFSSASSARRLARSSLCEESCVPLLYHKMSRPSAQRPRGAATELPR